MSTTETGDPVSVVPAGSVTEVPEALAPAVPAPELPVTTEPEPAPVQAIGDEKEGWEPLDGGRCRFWIDGRPYTFRKPSFQEIEDFHVQASELAEDEPDDLSASEKTHWYWNSLLNLMRKAFERFADKRLPESKDDIPAWIGNSGLSARLIQHWMNVPLASGGK